MQHLEERQQAVDARAELGTTHRISRFTRALARPTHPSLFSHRNALYNDSHVCPFTAHNTLHQIAFLIFFAI